MRKLGLKKKEKKDEVQKTETKDDDQTNKIEEEIKPIVNVKQNENNVKNDKKQESKNDDKNQKDEIDFSQVLIKREALKKKYNEIEEFN
jgi:hypothetical protein